MWLKLIGSSMVIVTGACLGFGMSARYCERPRQIRQLISCLATLKSYVNYVVMPLPEAFARCTNGVDGPVANLFCKTAELLRQNGCLTPCEALNRTIDELRDELAFCKPELEVMDTLASNIGFIGREEQQQYFCMVQEQLQEIEEDALKLKDSNVKVYRYLGICGGLALVILLV